MSDQYFLAEELEEISQIVSVDTLEEAKHRMQMWYEYQADLFIEHAHDY